MSACLQFGCETIPNAAAPGTVLRDQEPGVEHDIADRMVRVIEQALNRDAIIGAQLAVGSARAPAAVREFGVIAPECAQVVHRKTLFCIGSCSKPVASACIMTMVDDGTLSLDEPIDTWIDGFSNPRLDDGAPLERAPTLRELLAHRGGIYSQRTPMTPDQVSAIRDFRLTLAESVDVISRQPLGAVPGMAFRYSGAGYCVIGRAAELAAGSDFNDLIHERLCRPLGMSRTTYTPPRGEGNIAIGGSVKDGAATGGGELPHQLGDELRLVLVGGGLYSTGEDMAAFARMILNRGLHGTAPILSRSAWSETIRRLYPGKPYGLGWTLRVKDDQIASVHHFGALGSARSMMLVDFADEYYVVVLWTVRDPTAPDIRRELQRARLRPTQALSFESAVRKRIGGGSPCV